MTATAAPAGTIDLGAIGASLEPRPMVEASGVSKWFGDVVAVSDGQLLAGSRRHRPAGPERRRQVDDAAAAAGLIPPDRGELRILGRDPRADIAVLRRIGLVPQQETVFDSQTAFEFVQHGRGAARHPQARSGCEAGARPRRARAPTTLAD